MKYLLDTNALLYTFSASGELSARARRIVCSESDLSVSIASFWEIAIKQSIGKLRFNMSIPDLEARCNERDIRVLHILPSALEHVKSLPHIHGDPFDRIIIAHAMTENMAIVTRDRVIPQYKVKTIW